MPASAIKLKLSKGDPHATDYPPYSVLHDHTKGPTPMNSFLATFITIIAHTPISVWPLYVLLVFLGFLRTCDSVIPLWRMLILPIVFYQSSLPCSRY